jgi:hypothetical protein
MSSIESLLRQSSFFEALGFLKFIKVDLEQIREKHSSPILNQWLAHTFCSVFERVVIEIKE